MISRLNYDKCCLCRSCSDTCPTDAIQFSTYIEGFYYPTIDADKCIGCNRCDVVCPEMGSGNTIQEGFPLTFAARSMRPEVRMQSSSGGIFYELAVNIINSDGYVCGAVFDEEFCVKHIVSNDMVEVAKMCGSKYVQSDTSGIYRQVKKLLDEDKRVLFCGCPCQCAALRKFLGAPYENLVLVDFICHGVPSQSMLNSYQGLLEKRYKSRTKSFYFRNKEYGWHNFSVRVEFENEKIYSERYTIDSYMRAFLNGAIMQAACYSCSFKEFKSGSDITIGDFWGAEVSCPEFDDNMGLSAVFVNSTKGQELITSTGNVELKPADKEVVIAYNRNVMEPSKPSEIRDRMLVYASENGYGEAIEHFFRVNSFERIKRRLKYRLKCILFALVGKDRPLY